MIIESLLDTDLYKLTVPQVILQWTKYKSIPMEYEFTCRNNINFTKKMVTRITEEIHNLEKLSFTEEELLFLEKQLIFNTEFLDRLEEFKFQPKTDIKIDFKDKLKIHISAPDLRAMYYETFILSIINEVYSQSFPDQKTYKKNAFEDLINKTRKISEYGDNFKFMEFGTRRRFSKKNQEKVIEAFASDARFKDNFLGTSNMFFAMKHNIKALGTMSHEFFMFMQSFSPVQKSQLKALEIWSEFYGTKLATALTDTFGNEKFIKDLEECPELMLKYSGFRHDSGDPLEWAMGLLQHFQKNNVDATKKTFVFSDSLNIDKAINILEILKGKVNVVFGIGTDLTFSPAIGLVVPQNVIKMTKCNGQPVCKLSANPEKAMCKDPVYLSYVRHAIKEY